MADRIPTISGHETGITKPTQEAPADAVAADAPARVPALARAVVGQAAVRRIHTEKHPSDKKHRFDSRTAKKDRHRKVSVFLAVAKNE